MTLIIGIAGRRATGVEAARRTNSAFERLLADTEAWDVLVNPDDGTESALRMEDIAALPMVEDAFASMASSSAPAPSTRSRSSTPARRSSRPTALGLRAGPTLVGRVGCRTRTPSKRSSSRTGRRRARAGRGGPLPGAVMSFEDLAPLEEFTSEEEALAAFNDPDLGRAVELTMVGVGSQFDEIVVDEGFGGGNIVVTPAFYDAYDQPSAGYWAVSSPPVPRRARRLPAGLEALVPEDEAIAFQSRVGSRISSTAPSGQVVALWLFTAVAAAMALVLVGQAISRRLQVDAAGLAPSAPSVHPWPAHRHRGVPHGPCRRRRRGPAVLVAVVASPLAPVGVARDAEPDPGIRVDLPVLVVGGIAMASPVHLLALRPTYVSARTRICGRPVGPGPGGGGRARAAGRRGCPVRP